MKTIGIIGGTSWFSTLDYYKKINQYTNEILGGSHSAKILLYSINFHDFKEYVDQDNWQEISMMFTKIAVDLQAAGADFIMIAANTPHTIADFIQEKIQIPLLHIAEATGIVLAEHQKVKVGLIGTKPTMEKDFFKQRLSSCGIKSIVPDVIDRDFIHQVVFNELSKGIFNADTRNKIRAIIEKLKEQGAQAIIFACTEFGLLIDPAQSSLPVYDTAEIHIRAAVKLALNQ